MYYWQQKPLWDKHEVMDCMRVDALSNDAVLQFRDAAERFVLIRDKGLPLLIPFCAKGKKLSAMLTMGRVPYLPQRMLQPYLVSVPGRALDEMRKAGFVQEHESGVWLLSNRNLYRDDQGLNPGSAAHDDTIWGV